MHHLFPEAPYERSLGGGLVMRSPRDAEDVERLASFNGHIHGPGVAAMTRALLRDHPSMRSDYWLFVEDAREHRVVSAMSMLPWVLRYEEIALRAGEMGIVGTLEAYRGRGLIRLLNERFTELLRESTFDLSHIQGIPFFYRQFGYEYAIPLEVDWRIEPHLIPERGPAGDEYRLRQATMDDVPALMRLYEQATCQLGISAARDEAIWRYLLGPSMSTEMAAETFLALDPAGRQVGYMRVARHGFGTGLNVGETSQLTWDTALAMLRHLKLLATERGKPYIRLNLPDDNPLVRVARCYGAHSAGAYAWQIRLLDVPALLTKVAPVLERRLAASALGGFSSSLRLDLYRHVFDLHFEAGRLAAVRPPVSGAAGVVRLPPGLLAPLLLGYRSLSELTQAYHDVSAGGLAPALVDVLFPRMPSFLYSIY
jgi:hypothetical protein